jgi:hypothetical protein
MLLMLSVTACDSKELTLFDGDDDSSSDSTQELAVEVDYADVYLNVKVTIPPDISIARSNSRATVAASTDYRGNTVDEDDVKFVTVFMVSYDAAIGADDWSTCKYATMAVDQTETGYNAATGDYTANLKFVLTSVPCGDKHIYASANLSNELISQCAATGEFHAPDSAGADDYAEVLSNFINSADGRMAMFSANRASLTLQGSDSDKPFSCSFELERMLAKVLLTCDMEPDGEHVKVKANVASKYSSEYRGWMRLADVRFRLGTTNRATYFFKRTDSAGNVVDPNYAVADQLTADTRSGKWTYAGNFANDFTYSESVERNFRDESDSMNALAYDDDRMLDDSPQRYSEGMYCLENTTDNAWSSIPGYADYLKVRSNWFAGPRLINTTVDISTRYTPAVIVGEGGISINSAYSSANPELKYLVTLHPQCFTTEESAGAYVVDQSAANSFTYYSLYIGNCFYFFTYNGARELMRIAAENGVTDLNFSKFTTHANGEIFYHTYLSRIINGSADQSINGIVRNNFYVVRCTYMSVPAPVDAATATYSRAM